MEHLRDQWRKTAISGTYWRVHSRNRPFSLSDAFSVPMSSFGDRDKTNRQARPGYSCMANPWHLWVYCLAMGWLADGYVQDSDVIEFSGRPITKGDFTDLGVPESAIEWLWDGGRGVDSEPLVMPDMRTVRKQSWSSFEKMLLGTPLPSGPQASDVRFNSGLANWSDLAEILHERKGRYARESGPVIDFLIGKFILKTANFDDISLDAGDMRFYEWEGQQQKANGAGRKINTVREASELGNKVLADYGFDPAKVSWTMGGWESWTKLDGDRIEINIGYGYQGDGAASAWTVLHEVAHAILFFRGVSHRHGANFEALLLELLQRYTRVRNIKRRSARTSYPQPPAGGHFGDAPDLTNVLWHSSTTGRIVGPFVHLGPIDAARDRAQSIRQMNQELSPEEMALIPKKWIVDWAKTQTYACVLTVPIRPGYTDDQVNLVQQANTLPSDLRAPAAMGYTNAYERRGTMSVMATVDAVKVVGIGDLPNTFWLDTPVSPQEAERLSGRLKEYFRARSEWEASA